jgi:rubrerythrin
MKDLLPPHDPIEAMGEAYELLLEKALQKAHQSGNLVHHTIGVVRDEIVSMKKLSNDEVIKLEEYVKRDLSDAARYLDKTGKELKDWLGFEMELVKHEFWDRFSKAADQTTIALKELKRQAENAEYHTGELVGLGTLVCDQCGKKLHFHKPGHIPPCPKCTSTRFHRQNFASEKSS